MDFQFDISIIYFNNNISFIFTSLFYIYESFFLSSYSVLNLDQIQKVDILPVLISLVHNCTSF